MNLVALGADVVLSTTLGTDAEGDLARAALQRDNLTVLVEESASGTEQHLNLMDDHGGRISVYLHLPDPPTTAAHDDELASALAACDVAVVDLAEASRALLARAHTAGKPVWCDVHDYDGTADFHRDWVDGADVLFLNDDAMSDPVPFMRSRVAAGASLVVCTRGARGAVAVTGDEELHVPVRAIDDALDTNGAGDAFFSGFLVATLTGHDLSGAMEAGHRQAGACLRSPGLAPQA